MIGIDFSVNVEVHGLHIGTWFGLVSKRSLLLQQTVGKFMPKTFVSHISKE